MKRINLCMFGIVSGISWTVIPINNLVTNRALIMLAGATTGLVVTFAILPFLKKSSDVILVGITSFPLGAFVFGAALSYVQIFADAILTNSFPSVANAVFGPFMAGLGCAIFTTLVLPLAAIVYPAAILNVWILLKIIERCRLKEDVVKPQAI